MDGSGVGLCVCCLGIPWLHLCTSVHGQDWFYMYAPSLASRKRNTFIPQSCMWASGFLSVFLRAEKKTIFIWHWAVKSRDPPRWCVLHLSSLQCRWAPEEVTCIPSPAQRQFCSFDSKVLSPVPKAVSDTDRPGMSFWICVRAFQRGRQSVSNDQPLCREMQVWFRWGASILSQGPVVSHAACVSLRGKLARDRHRHEGSDERKRMNVCKKEKVLVFGPQERKTKRECWWRKERVKHGGIRARGLFTFSTCLWQQSSQAATVGVTLPAVPESSAGRRDLHRETQADTCYSKAEVKHREQRKVMYQALISYS